MNFSKTIMVQRKWLVATALAGILATAPPAMAETPADTLVQGYALDEIITMDPAEAFELSTAEISANIYDLLVRFDVSDTSKVQGDLAKNWTISDDGLVYTFTLKPGLTFASGNPVTAEDVAWSFERVIKLDKAPAFILSQFGITSDNVTEKAKAEGPHTFVFTVDRPYAPSFVLNCLASSASAVVDKKLVVDHAIPVVPSTDYKWDSDFGNDWLKTHSAGSGVFKLREWRANEAVVIDRNAAYHGSKAKLARVVYRHMKESAAQRLSLEAGDIDVARNLEPNDLEAMAKSELVDLVEAPKGTVFYIGLNQKNQRLATPEVRQAFRYLVDYDAIGQTLIKGIGRVHQTFLPAGVLGELNDRPFKLDVAKAKALLEKAGLKDGFSVTMDVRNAQPVTGIAESIQQTAAAAGITIEIIPGDDKQTLTKYRARNHDIYIGQWGQDYFDPNSNAQAFASNTDNSDRSKNSTLAWRNAWGVSELTAKTDAALMETDSAKRRAIYEDIQRTVLETSPFVLLFQQIEVAGVRKNVRGLKLGPSFDTNFVGNVTKE